MHTRYRKILDNDYLLKSFRFFAFWLVFFALIFKLDIVSEAGVRTTDIDTYIRSTGDSYSGLSDAEKTGYNKARTSMMNPWTHVSFSSNKEYEGYCCYIYDHPAIANNFSLLTRAQGEETLLAAARLASRASGSTPYEQALSLHDLLCEQITYNMLGGSWYGQSAYEGLVKGVSVCHGYAEAYKLLCDLKGIPCQIVYGLGGDRSGTENHAWNVIELDDGEWYEVDTTWDDDPEDIVHEYFCLTTQNITRHVMVLYGRTTVHIRQKIKGEKIASLAPVANGTKYVNIPVTGFYVDGTVINVGESVKWNAVIQPENATFKKVKWTSGNNSVATVDSSGNVTGVKAGNVSIIAKIDHYSYEVNTNVYESDSGSDPAGEQQEELPDKSLEEGQIASETETKEPQTNPEADASDVQTASETNTPDNENTAETAESENNTSETTEPEQLVAKTEEAEVAPQEGSAAKNEKAVDGTSENITSENEPVSSDSKVGDTPTAQEQVKQDTSPNIIGVSKITLTGEKVLRNGSSIRLKAGVAPSDADNKKLKWSSSNASVAAVNSAGKVTAKKTGTVTIKAVAADGSGVYGSIKIKVISKTANPPASGIVTKTKSVNVKSQGSRRVKVSWTEQSKAIRYEIQIATDKKFKNNLVAKTAEKTKSYLSLKYSKKGTVYVRVRAVDQYGYVGKWSAIKTAKVR